MRIAIFGVGGAGGRFGAQLASAGEDVVFIARGKHLDAIVTEGLRLETPEGEMVVHPANASDDPAQVGPVDVVIVGVKAWQVKEAARAMRPMITQDTYVLPLQNGIEAAAHLSEVLGAEHVIGGLCGTFSWIDAPGRIRSIGQVHFVRFGELDNLTTKRIRELAQSFGRAGVDVEIPPDIHIAIWDKFLFVASFGGVGAVTRAPIGILRSIPETRGMLEKCMHEIYDVARASDIDLKEDIIAKKMEFVDSLDPAGTSSLQRDIAAGRPSELESWNGAVVRAGREAGVAAPLHQFIYQALLPLELRARKQVEFPS